MQDEIIITRMRVIMKEQYNSYIMETISEFIKFLEEDKNIQEYIAENDKITYDISWPEEIHETISNYLIDRCSPYVYDMSQGWLELKDEDNRQKYKPHEFHIYSIMKCLE